MAQRYKDLFPVEKRESYQTPPPHLSANGEEPLAPARGKGSGGKKPLRQQAPGMNWTPTLHSKVGMSAG